MLPLKITTFLYQFDEIAYFFPCKQLQVCCCIIAVFWGLGKCGMWNAHLFDVWI